MDIRYFEEINEYISIQKGLKDIRDGKVVDYKSFLEAVKSSNGEH